MRKNVRDEVRTLYGFACGYCGVSEIDHGGELTIDHFVPQSAGGTDDLANLVYCCFRCNVYKGALLPEHVRRDVAKRLLHPGFEPLDEHLKVDPMTGLMEGLTETGRFHVAALQLNRPALVAYRQQRELAAQLDAVIANVQSEIEQLESLLRYLAEYLDLTSRWSTSPHNSP